MKELHLLVWLTQLGFSVAFPLAGFVLLGVWLHTDRGWGIWVFWVCLVLGFICAVVGFRDSLRAMQLLSADKKKEEHPTAFNDHS